MTDVELREKLTGENGRCWVECECVKESAAGFPKDWTCNRGCHGKGYVWRTDEKGRELIAAAVDEYRHGLTRSEQVAWFNSVESNVRRTLHMMWDNRHGKDYAADLEQHVAAYVEPFEYDLETLKRDLREAGWEVGLNLKPTDCVAIVWPPGWDVAKHPDYRAEADTELDALLSAADQATGGM